jgi:hypothetical protein
MLMRNPAAQADTFMDWHTSFYLNIQKADATGCFFASDKHTARKLGSGVNHKAVERAVHHARRGAV